MKTKYKAGDRVKFTAAWVTKNNVGPERHVAQICERTFFRVYGYWNGLVDIQNIIDEAAINRLESLPESIGDVGMHRMVREADLERA
jgi:hypothetical protein